MDYRVGLVLSGGAARGIAHLGMWQALDENKVPVDVFAGTSSGAIAAVLIASGTKPQTVKEKLKELDFGSELKLRLPWQGMFDNHELFEELEDLFEYQHLEELPVKVFITCTNLISGKQEVFSKGEIIPILRAASSVPLVFKPVTLDEQVLADGGIVSNLPTKPLAGKCKFLIGCNVNPLGFETNLDSIKDILLRTLHLSIWGNVKENIKDLDLYLEPEGLYEFKLWDTSHIDEIYQRGYDYTIRMLHEEGYLEKINKKLTS